MGKHVVWLFGAAPRTQKTLVDNPSFGAPITFMVERAGYAVNLAILAYANPGNNHDNI